MSENTEKQYYFNPFLLISVVLLSVGSWAYIYSNILIDTDLGWLLQCLERFIAGGTYTKDFYETNPPLSFLVYLPVYPFLESDPHTIKTAVTISFLFYILVSNTLTTLLLRKYSFPPYLITLCIASLLMAQTWAMGISFATKDHLIFVLLPPLCLAQFLITQKILRTSPLAVLSIIIGSLALCLKPHYLLVPIAMWIHRVYTTKSLISVIASADFWLVTLVTSGYLGLTMVFFPDYMEIIFPDVLSLYRDEVPMQVFDKAVFLAFAVFASGCALLISDKIPEKKKTTHAIYALSFLSFVCFVPYVLQYKGFTYQAAPFIGFAAAAFFMAMSALFYLMAHRTHSAAWYATIAFSFLCLPLTTGFPPNLNLTHKKFAEVEYFKKIKALATENKAYAIYDMKPAYLALPYYFHISNGSRFGQLWPLYNLSEQYKIATDEEKPQIKDRMNAVIDMIAEDMVRFKPSVISIPQYPDHDGGKPTSMYLDFLKKNQKFSTSFENYTLKETVVFDTGIFEGNLSLIKDTKITFDLYVLKSDTEKPQQGDTP